MSKNVQIFVAYKFATKMQFSYRKTVLVTFLIIILISTKPSGLQRFVSEKILIY